MADDVVITVGGRTFRKAITTSMDQDAYVMSRMREFGLMELAGSFDPAKDDLDTFGIKLLLAAFESGKLYEILAGTLVEEGVKWSRDVARANAVFFSEITAMADKEAIYSRIADIILDFLRVAAAWSPSSQKSSTRGAEAPSNGQTSPIEAPLSMTSESGTPSSETSPSMT